MKSVVLVLFVCLSIGYSAPSDSDKKGELPPEIEFRNHSYYVTIDVRKNEKTVRYCGGAQIGHEWVITAAECLHETGGNTIVMTHASTSLNYRRKYYQMEHASFTIHPKYNPRTKANNLALIKCASGVQPPYILPKVPLSSEKKTAYSQKPADVTVALSMKNETIYEFYVYVIKTNIVSPFWCKLAYILSVGSEHVCATRKIVKNSRADVGAPLVTEGASDGTIELVGVGTSIAPWTTWISLPSVFTKVKPHSDWIYSVTKLHTTESSNVATPTERNNAVTTFNK